MFAQKLLLPAFALLGAVAAQSSCKDAKTTFTINSQAEATQISSCGPGSVAGSVEIGNITGALDLTGPSAILGSLTVNGAIFLQTLSSSTIQSIATNPGSQWRMEELTVLNALTFNNLTEVGIVYFAGLKALVEFTFPASISKASSLTITNTFLQTLDGINLDSVGALEISNNNRLTKLNTQVVNVTESLTVTGNGKALQVKFPVLENAANATFRNISTLDVHSLAKVGGIFIIAGTSLPSFSAPNLTEVTGSVQFADNANMNNLTMDELVKVGGAFSINNTLAYNLDFPKLASVAGALNLAGNFTTPELPALTNVAGALNVQSKSQIDCSAFDSLKNSGAIQGSESCKTTDNPESLDGTGTGTGTSSGSGASPTKSKGAAVSYGVNEAVAGLSVIGGIMQMLL